jgi:hypothetical protein
VWGLGELVDAWCGALVSFDPALYAGEECAVLAARLGRAAKACETASARAAVRPRRYADRVSAPVGGCSTGEGRTALTAVQSRGACPDTEMALRAGAVSLAHAKEQKCLPESGEPIGRYGRRSAVTFSFSITAAGSETP